MIETELKTEFPEICQTVLDYVVQTESILTFCDVPLHTKGLIDYIKFTREKNKDKPLDTGALPRSTAALFYALDVTMLESGDRKLQDSQDDLSENEILEKRKEQLANLAKLAYKSITSNEQTRITFFKEDLEEVGLNADDVRDSILTCTKALVHGDSRKEWREIFSFPHLAHQEHMGGFHGTQVGV